VSYSTIGVENKIDDYSLNMVLISDVSQLFSLLTDLDYFDFSLLNFNLEGAN
jgi:hypothetical protein